MFQHYLRLFLAFVFFINIFTPSLLQAQQATDGKRRRILSTSTSRQELELMRRDYYSLPQDNTRVDTSIQLRPINTIKNPGLPLVTDGSISSRRQYISQRLENKVNERISDEGLNRLESMDPLALYEMHALPGRNTFLQTEKALLEQVEAEHESGKLDLTNTERIWKATKTAKILNLLEEGRQEYSAKTAVKRDNTYVAPPAIFTRPWNGPQRTKEPLQELYTDNNLHIGWIKYFLSGEEKFFLQNIAYKWSDWNYFYSTTPKIVSKYNHFSERYDHIRDIQPDFLNAWFKYFTTGPAKEITKYETDLLRYFVVERKHSLEEVAEAAIYFTDLLDPQEFASFAGEEREFIIQEFLEVEEILKKRLYSIKGKNWEDVNARGALRLALWNLYKFYYQTGIKETSGMEAPLEELLKGMQIRYSYYKHTAFSFPKEHYQPAKVFPLAAEGSFGDKLCKEAIEEAKSVDGNQEVYHTALQYATILLMQAKGNILPLMRYVDQNKESVDLTSPVVSDSAVVLQTAANEAYQDPFKLALFIGALRILSAPFEFSMRTRLSAVEHASLLYGNTPHKKQSIPALDDKIKAQLEKDKAYFAEMTGKLYCFMLSTYKRNDSFELDSDNFATLVTSLNSTYYDFYYPDGPIIQATGSPSILPKNMDNERTYCHPYYHVKVLENKKIDEIEEGIAMFVVDAALWIVGGWVIGALFKGASIVIRSSWVALKATPKALGAVNTVRKGRKIQAAVIEYKKAYRYSNYMRNVAKNSTVTQTYTRANTAARTAQGASTAQQSSRAATTVTAQGGKGATTITSQGAKGAGTATSASAGASSAASGSAAGTVGRETTRAVTQKSQLIYSDWNPFRNPKQLTNLTRTEYRPFTNEPLTWRLTDESLALFNAERGIRNYDILRKMRGVDQFGNTMKFFEPLPASRLFSFNPTIAQRELGVMSQYIQSGGLKELNIWGLTESGKLVPVVDGPWAKMMGNPLITRVFAADQGFAKLALNNPTSFIRLAASPNKPAVGLISELSFPFSSESIALSFLRKGYGLSGKNLFTKALLPTSWKTLPMAEWNYIKSSWKPTLKFFGAWEVGDIIAEPLITQWQEKTLLSLTNKAMTPYSGIFDEAGKWGQALTEFNYKNGSIPTASAHFASDLADNNKDPEYLFPLLAGGVGTGLDYVDVWKDIPLIGNMTDWIGKSLMSLGQGISSVPGGEYLSLPFILTSLPFQGAEPLKMMGGIEFPQEAKDMLREQTKHQAWKTRTDTNKIKRSYRKMADTMYENATQLISENVSEDRQKYFKSLTDEYRRNLTEAVKKPETANDIVPITEKFNQNFWLRSHEVNFIELKNLAKENLNTKLRKPVLTKIDQGMKAIDTIRQEDSILSEAEKEEKEKQLAGIYSNTVLALREQMYISQIMEEIENANQAYYIKFVQSSFAKVSQNIQPEKFDDYFQHLETNLANGFSILEFWVYYKKAFVTMQSQARELGNEELWGEIEQVLGKVEEYLNDPKPLTAEQQIEINNAYYTLYSKLEKSLEQNISLWEKGILEDIGSIGTKALAYIGSWQNKEAIKEGKAAIETFVQQATAVVKGEGLVSDKNEQLKQLLEGLYARLEGIYKEKELQQETKEELLPSSNTDLHTQAY